MTKSPGRQEFVVLFTQGLTMWRLIQFFRLAEVGSVQLQMEEMVSRGSRSVRPSPHTPSHSHSCSCVSCGVTISCAPSRLSPAAGTTHRRRNPYLFASRTVHSILNTYLPHGTGPTR